MNFTELFATHWQEFLALATAHSLAVASPGLDFAITTKHTVSYGKRIGRITALGIGVAILLHVSYAFLGFSVLVESNPVIYGVVKWVGAAFLIYLGIMSLRSSPKEFEATAIEKRKPISAKRAFTIGFLTNALNVKAILFFLFLFTTIVSENSPYVIKLFYGVWLSVYTFAWFYFVASVFGYRPVRAFFNKFGVWFDRAMGVLLLVLAIWLVVK